MTKNRLRKKRKMVPIYAMEDLLAHKNNPKKIGWMSDSDASGPVILDHETWTRLFGGGQHDRV